MCYTLILGPQDVLEASTKTKWWDDKNKEKDKTKKATNEPT